MVNSDHLRDLSEAHYLSHGAAGSYCSLFVSLPLAAQTSTVVLVKDENGFSRLSRANRRNNDQHQVCCKSEYRYACSCIRAGDWQDSISDDNQPQAGSDHGKIHGRRRCEVHPELPLHSGNSPNTRQRLDRFKRHWQPAHQCRLVNCDQSARTSHCILVAEESTGGCTTKLEPGAWITRPGFRLSSDFTHI